MLHVPCHKIQLPEKPFSNRRCYHYSSFQPPDQSFNWDSITNALFAAKKPTYHLYRFMPVRTYDPNIKGTCGDLRMSRFWALWPHILSGPCLDLMLSKILTGLRAWVTLSFIRFPGDLTPHHGHLSPCVQTWSESESCYQSRTKARISGISGPGLPVCGRD